MTQPQSVSSIRRKLFSMVMQETCDHSILELLLPDLHPIEHEDALWDFKKTIILDPLNKTHPDYSANCCEIVKDIAAFYNTFGGYVIIGIDDKTRSISQFNSSIDIDLITARIKTDTNAKIDFTFKKMEFLGQRFGLIFVPRRPNGIPPLQFRRDAKPRQSGTKAYKSGDIYLRDEASSAPATGAEALALLFSDVKRSVLGPTEVKLISITDNNLRARDPGFISFVGRDAYLDQLWRWLLDRFNPVRLVSGVGGVGKTTLVREFSELILERSPLGFERVIWLTAKKHHWDRFKGKASDAKVEHAPHFDSPETLFKTILLELGYLETEIDEEWTREEYVENLLKALTITPSFLVVDDLDTLEDPELQAEVFQTLVSVLSQTVPGASASSRAIITARLNIGAAPVQLMRVEGFDENEFDEYIELIMNELDFSLPLKKSSKLFKKFYAATEGSPLFAASILRIVARGPESLDACITQWKGASGEEVRKFAFERELSLLTDSQLRTVYAMCCLDGCSFVELKEVTKSSQLLLADDLQRLRDFHLITHIGLVEEGGMHYRVPNNISLLSDLIKEKIKTHGRIRAACDALRKQAGDTSREIAPIIRRVVAFWDQNEPNKALAVAQEASHTYNRKHPDIECILGRAYLRGIPPDPQRADAILRNAEALGCQRPELLDLWIEARRMRGDWRGVIELAERAYEASKMSKYVVDISAAYSNIADQELGEGHHTGAVDNFRRSARIANSAFAEGRAGGSVQQLGDIRRRAFLEAVRVARSAHSDPSAAIEVWEVCSEAFDCFVRTPFVLHSGVNSLVAWARHVTKMRETLSQNTRDKLFEKSEELYRVRDACIKKKWDDTSVLIMLDRAKKELMGLCKTYADLLSNAA